MERSLQKEILQILSEHRLVKNNKQQTPNVRSVQTPNELPCFKGSKGSIRSKGFY
jgi:hypothetical protein